MAAGLRGFVVGYLRKGVLQRGGVVRGECSGFWGGKGRLWARGDIDRDAVVKPVDDREAGRPREPVRPVARRRATATPR
jgi:hypothetical protein